jgi:3-hydroxyisobutyrate dehydrogenase-like beta-hydroxyacid dehydrogenase
MAVNIVLLSSAGEMGAALGGLLVKAGLRVLVPLGGRSESSIKRARQSGLEEAPSLQSAVQYADLVLSILPPSRAVSFAQQIFDAAPTPGGADGKGDPSTRPTYVDCNAIQPSTVVRISELVSPKFRFVSGSIIGNPPRPHDGYEPTIYASSAKENEDALRTFAELCRKGTLKIKTLGGGLDAASALKVLYFRLTSAHPLPIVTHWSPVGQNSYAATTKGFTGLVANNVLCKSLWPHTPEHRLSLRWTD